MSKLPVVLLLLLSSSGLADEFTTGAAQAAQSTYEADLLAARKKYVSALDHAALAAVQAGDLQEVARIAARKSELETGSDDPIVAARLALIDTVWTFDRPGKPNRVTFRSRGKVTVYKGGDGVWEMLESHVGAMKFQDEMFIFKFNDDLTEFEVVAYGRIKTNYASSRKVGPAPVKSQTD
ncbi:MAG: hypothetical protein ACK5Q5_19030 [Planctomycetaceae bacterium]